MNWTPFDATGAGDVDRKPCVRFDSHMNDPITDIAAWLESRRVTVEPVDDDALVGIGHAQTHLRSLLGRLRCETVPGVLPPPVRSTLLYGPPGTGKTALSRWFVGQLDDVPAYDLPAEQLTPEVIRAAFAHLATRPRSLVFLAEVDAIGLDRREADPEATAVPVRAARGARRARHRPARPGTRRSSRRPTASSMSWTGP